MILKSEKVLDRFRGPGRCLGCGKPCEAREPHHILSRGAGGSDVSWNLCGLERACHDLAHSDPSFKDQLFVRVALREGVNMNVIEEARSFILRLPKGTSLANIDILMRELSPAASVLVTRAFAEADE